MTKNQLSDSKLPIYMQVYRQVLNDIHAGKWKTGERLPADMAFAKELGVNHLTLKKAMNRLAAEGYLTRTRGRGTFVSPVLPKKKTQITGKRITLIFDIVSESSFHSDFFLKLYKEVIDMGLTLELISANRNRTTQFKQIMELFSDPDSAGCIVWPLLSVRQLESLAAAKPENYPLVFINHKPEIDVRGIDFSGYDDFGSGQILGEYITSLGFENCVVFQTKSSRNTATSAYRIAGLKQALKFPVQVINTNERITNADIEEYFKEHDYNGRTAVVFISDADYSYEKNSFGDNIELFMFFTSVQPFCHGIMLSSPQMGINAMEIIKIRRGGDDSFAIIRRITGKII